MRNDANRKRGLVKHLVHFALWACLLMTAGACGNSTSTSQTPSAESESREAAPQAQVAQTVADNQKAQDLGSAVGTSDGDAATVLPTDDGEVALNAAPDLLSIDHGVDPDAVADWPLFRGDALGTGVARGPLPEQLEVLWRFPTQDGAFEGSVAIVDGVVYAGCLDGNLYAIDLQTGQERWKFHTDLGFVAAPSVRAGKVYIGDVEGRFYCLSAATGEPIWSFQAQAEIDAGANFYQDKVLIGSQDATLYCFTADDGKEVWKHQIEDQIRCMPTVVDGRAFLAGCDGKLHIIDLETGKSTAQVDIGSQTGCTPAVLGNLVFFGTEGETFFCIDWAAAKVVWSYRNPERSLPYRSSAAVVPDRVLVGCRDKLVHCFDPQQGTELWTLPTRARIDSSPVIVGRRAYVGSADGKIYGIDIDTGKSVWQYEAGGGFTAAPAVAEGCLVIGSDDGILYCFGSKKES
jgi:outer membrane protein assembly factor BamB